MTGLVCFWYAQGAQYLKLASNLHGYMEQAQKVLKNTAARCGESSKEQARMESPSPIPRLPRVLAASSRVFWFFSQKALLEVVWNRIGVR